MAVEKSLLSKLRKKTGYTFANCKNALELHENDIEKAEIWLQKQAQELGWAKAVKLQGRPTSQGLVGLAKKNETIAMIEVNCETDFVARNEKFRELVANLTKICLQHDYKSETEEAISKIFLDASQLNEMTSLDSNKSIYDLVALSIGLIGENIAVKRGVIVRSSGKFRLTWGIHPAPSHQKQNDGVALGKYGAILAFDNVVSEAVVSDVDVEQTAAQICQHIIGMNPQSIGNTESQPSENADDENCLFHQDFLLDAEMKVGQVLEETGLRPLDFVRFECGEQNASSNVEQENVNRLAA